MTATDAGETSGRRSISRPRFLSPKSKHSNISADRESLNRKYLYFFDLKPVEQKSQILNLLKRLSHWQLHQWKQLNSMATLALA